MAGRVDVVSPHPVVVIDVDDNGRILIDGIVVPGGESADPYREAVHAVALEVARPLGLPVRAVATDPYGTTRLLIHPNGSVSDIEIVLPTSITTSPTLPEADGPAQVVDAAPAEYPAGIPRELTAQGWLAARDESRAASAAASESRPGRRIPSRVGVLLAIAAAVVLGTAATVITPDDEEPSETPAAESGDAGADNIVPQAPSGALGQPVVRREAPLRLLQLQSASATGSVGSATLRVSVSRPGALQLVLRSAGGGSAEQRVQVASPGVSTVVVRDLAAGEWSWTVRAPGEPALTGAVRVTEPPAVVPVDTYEPPTTYEPPVTIGGDTPDGGGEGGGDDGGDDADSGGGSGGDGPVDPDLPDGPNGPVG